MSAPCVQRRVLLVTLLLVLFGSLAVSAAVSAAPARPFVALDLGTLGGLSSSAAAISPSGQVVGRSTLSAGDFLDDHAFSWTRSGGMVDLGTLGGTWSEAVAVSPRGQVVGFSGPPANFPGHAFSWTPET